VRVLHYDMIHKWCYKSSEKHGGTTSISYSTFVSVTIHRVLKTVNDWALDKVHALIFKTHLL